MAEVTERKSLGGGGGRGGGGGWLASIPLITAAAMLQTCVNTASKWYADTG